LLLPVGASSALVLPVGVSSAFVLPVGVSSALLLPVSVSSALLLPVGVSSALVLPVGVFSVDGGCMDSGIGHHFCYVFRRLVETVNSPHRWYGALYPRTVFSRLSGLTVFPLSFFLIKGINSLN
jgi:hypothetical protein